MNVERRKRADLTVYRALGGTRVSRWDCRAQNMLVHRFVKICFHYGATDVGVLHPTTTKKEKVKASRERSGRGRCFHCVCAPYPRMPSAKPHEVSSVIGSEMDAPAAVTVAIWNCTGRR